MVQLTLPKNSRVTAGKTWPKPEGATESRFLFVTVEFDQSLIPPPPPPAKPGDKPKDKDLAFGTDFTDHMFLAEWPPDAAEPTDYWLSDLPATTPLPELVMNTAVPGTRAALPAADLMKISIGRLASAIRSIISLRPLAQVVSRVKATAPTSSGNQPPSGTLIKLAPK